MIFAGVVLGIPGLQVHALAHKTSTPSTNLGDSAWANGTFKVSEQTSTSLTPASTTSTSYSASLLGNPMCNRAVTNCLYNNASPTPTYWDAGYLDQDLQDSPVSNPYASAVSMLVAFPGSGAPSSFVQAGNYLAVGMFAESFSKVTCNDWGSFAMLYLTASNQPEVIGEVWEFCDAAPSSSFPLFVFGESWTCSCLTSLNYQNLIQLEMAYTSTSLTWYATVGGVQYNLFQYTPQSEQNTVFSVGTYNSHLPCAIPPCITLNVKRFQFGVMTQATPIGLFNSYIGAPKYLYSSTSQWTNVEKASWFGNQYALVDNEYSVGTNEGYNDGASCISGGSFPGRSNSLLFGQVVIKPLGGFSAAHGLWDSNCQQDIYPPGASFVGSTPPSGSWENNAFSVSLSNFENGPVSSGVALCFWSVDYNNGGWVNALPAQVIGCNSTQTVTVGSSGYCQSNGANACRVNAWSEDWLGNVGGTTTFELPGDGDSLTEGNGFSNWSCSAYCSSCPISSSTSHIVGSTSNQASWSGGGYCSGFVSYPGNGGAGWDTTKWGSSGNPPVVSVWIKSPEIPYGFQFVFQTGQYSWFLGDVLPEGVNSNSGLAINDANWHLFQYAFGPYGNNFQASCDSRTGQCPSWSNINQFSFDVQYTSIFSSGNFYWDGFVMMNPSLTQASQQFSIGDFGLSSNPTSVTALAGSNAGSTISVTSSGFTGTVNLAASPSQSGLTCTLTPGSVTLSSTTASATSALSCSGSAGTYSVTVTGTGNNLSHSTTVSYTVQDFTIVTSPTSITVNAGSTGTSTVTITAVNGFSGIVNLVTTTPSSCTVSPTSVTGSGSATLSCTFNAAITTQVGVTGTSGGLSHFAYVNYVVRDFSISASSPTTVNEGSSTTSTITITYLNGFAGTVALTDIVPSGLTCGSISPSSVTGSGSATVSCSATVAGGYVLTIKGTSGSLIHSTSATFAFAGFTVIATSPSGNVGSSITSTITVSAVNGFSGTVSLTDTLPSGLTCGAITPISVTGFGTATLSCSSSSTTSYSVTIKGTSGALSHSATALYAFTDFSIAFSPSSVTISAGTTGQILVTLTSLNGFSGTISLSQSVTPAPTDAPTVPASGIVNLGPAQTFSYYLVISTVTTTPQQTYSVTFTGASGNLSHSKSATASVTAPPPLPSYVFPGTFTQSGGVSGAQVIALAGLPVSVKVTLSSTTSQSAHLSVEVRADVVFYSDSTAAWLNQTVTVGSGTAVTVESFTPAIVTSGCIGCIRQFFIRVWWGGQLIYDPTDPNTRENVQTTSSDFSVCCSQSNSLLTGGEQSYTGINIQSRNGFAGTVTLSLSATTLGDTTVSLSPTSVTLSSGQLIATTLTIVTGSQTGTWILTVTAQSGSLVRSVTFTITVSACCTGGGGGSVAAGTLITLADGTQIPVQNLRVGMQLLSYDMATHQYVTTTLTRFVTVATNNTMVITTSTGKPLIVDQNPAQKVYVMLPNGTWTLLPVTQLQIGYKLFDATTQSWVPITSIHYENGGNHVMYDLYPTAPGNYIANGYLDPYKT